MHELFTKVLSRRDLSCAGDLFSVSDADIVNDISAVLAEINPIISQPDYLRNSNDQSLVEICITRVLACIRETHTMERYCSGLVDLLKTCLAWNLQSSENNKEDAPHAKIAADIISSIFLNYDKRELMKLALPVAVQFLPKGSKELERNLGSYLSLAAIDYAYLLSPHVASIMQSILAGNYGLLRVLSQVYEVSPETVTPHAPSLIDLLPKCDAQEKLPALQLYLLIAQQKPKVLEPCIPQLCGFLKDSSASAITMQILLKLAEKNTTNLLARHFDVIHKSAKRNLANLSLMAQLLAVAGRSDKDNAKLALDFVLEHLPNADRATQTLLQQEATKLCSAHPILFTDKVLVCIRQKNALSSQQKLASADTRTNVEGGNKMSGGVTIVNLNRSDASNVAIKVQPPAPPAASAAAAVVSTALKSAAAATKSGVNLSESHHHQPNPTNMEPVAVASTRTVVAVANPSTAIGRIQQKHKSHHSRSSPNSPRDLSRKTLSTVNAKNASSSHTTTTAIGGAPSGPSATSAVAVAVPPTPPHTSYTRRLKAGDSRSTGRLHPVNNTHRSMTRLNVAGGSVGGLHKSMTRLGSSQQLSQQNSVSNLQANSNSNLTAQSKNPIPVVPTPASSSKNVAVNTSQQPGKWSNATPSTQVTSGGVTVTTSPSKARPQSQGPATLLNASNAMLKYSTDALNQSAGSISILQNPVSVQHALPATSQPQPQPQPSQPRTAPVTKLPLNGEHTYEVIVSGPTTNVTSRRNDNTSRTLLNANGEDENLQRISIFEPCNLMRDPVQQFCEKNFASIKTYMDEISESLPPATRCGVEVTNEYAERRSKKLAKLYFACQIRSQYCLYSKTLFTMRTRNPKIWIHLMFLDFQIRHYIKEKTALSTREPGISNLKNIWQLLKVENRSFTELVTSQFPSAKDREILINELRHSGFLDVFEVLKTDKSDSTNNELDYQWGCFLCVHPEKAVGIFSDSNQPVIEGQLKEKKGKWRLFRRWRTRYFTLSGAHLSCKGSTFQSGGESIDVNQIRSVKVSRGARNIPKAFEIFTGDQTLILKPKDGKNAEEWVQCLSIVVAHSQARDNPNTKTNSLPARGMGNSKPSFS